MRLFMKDKLRGKQLNVVVGCVLHLQLMSEGIRKSQILTPILNCKFLNRNPAKAYVNLIDAMFDILDL